MDMVKRDSFELLSAYLDGEVTASERRQVEEWLATDDSIKSLYARLLKLRQGLRNCPIPQAQHTPEETFQQVWNRIRRRYQLAWIGGGAAIAACVISSLAGLLPGSESRNLQLAQQPEQPKATMAQPAVTASPLMVALNNPVIEIPKTAVANPEDNSANSVKHNSQNREPNIN
ncbi:putative transmembrane anti-sigma factor [Richelia sinica FACHB-800]|uniref:Transmembrane anti-sigma factor n=1 Tax=Richelia sinica FACHB-800 TaxID=1357546 RepID=A0A975T6D2_9NOST|nr:putative transmembrane anti-sigma factor [Richelia sinica FACHB-800]